MHERSQLLSVVLEEERGAHPRARSLLPVVLLGSFIVLSSQKQELKINRPSKYPGPETPHLNWPDVLARSDRCACGIVQYFHLEQSRHVVGPAARQAPAHPLMKNRAGFESVKPLCCVTVQRRATWVLARCDLHRIVSCCCEQASCIVWVWEACERSSFAALRTSPQKAGLSLSLTTIAIV